MIWYTHFPMPKHPEQRRSFKEHQPLPYYLAATFKTRDEAEQPYQRAQDMVFSPTYDLDLSAFRFERKLRDPSQPPLARPWLVVVLGEQPPEPIDHQLRQILSSGEMITLALETVATLAQRRTQETKKGNWVEGHYTQGVIIPEVPIKFRRKPKGKGHRRK